MFAPTKEEIFADLKWKAEHMHSRGYYLDKTVLELMEYLCEHGEVPYEWKTEVKNKVNTKSKEPESIILPPDLPTDTRNG